MSKVSKRVGKYQVNDHVELHYWNQYEWEFEILHAGLDDRKSNRLIVLASMLTEEFVQRGINPLRIPEFVELSKEVFSL